MSLAGGAADVVVRLGIAMFALQAAIGAANDVSDRGTDAGTRDDKPLAAGILGTGEALAVIALGLTLGLGLSALSGPVVLAVAVGGVLAGLAYDAGLGRTPWSWLPWVVGLPLLPVYAWLGAGGAIPDHGLLLVGLAGVAGVGLAVANALGDLDRDRTAGSRTLAVVLGPTRAWALGAALLGVVVVAAAVTRVAIGDGLGPGDLGLAGGAAAVGLGLGLGRSGVGARRERAWEIQAMGTGLMAAGWVLATGVGTRL